ncbi:hypothetical protein AVEN_256528-1 [Araneus ventricosus]|uniref:Uncharacterized protein n=1 Tax=Araneus ventricosus TaxID=182803 RepID=A0A4Y2K325_ARAVE|nr:hypothetical protein AVEN_256528-1 [Araneus ventricosus]
MYDETVFLDFSLSLIAPEEFCFAVIFSSSDKVSSTTSYCETRIQHHEIFSGQLLALLFHNLIYIIVIHLQFYYPGKDTISLTTDFSPRQASHGNYSL